MPDDGNAKSADSKKQEEPLTPRKVMWGLLSAIWTQKTIVGLVVYLYLSGIGFVYDYVFYRFGYGLEILPYLTVEDVAFSVLKHWMLIVVPAIIIPVAVIVLLLLWQSGIITNSLTRDQVIPWLDVIIRELKASPAKPPSRPSDTANQPSTEQNSQPGDQAPAEPGPPDQAPVTTAPQELTLADRFLDLRTKCAEKLMEFKEQSAERLGGAITRLAQVMSSMAWSVKPRPEPSDPSGQPSTDQASQPGGQAPTDGPPDQAPVATAPQESTLVDRFFASLTKCAKKLMELMGRSVTQLARTMSFLRFQVMYWSVVFVRWAVLGLAEAIYWLVLGLAEVVYWSANLVRWLVIFVRWAVWSVTWLCRGFPQLFLALVVLVSSVVLPVLAAVSIANHQAGKPLTATDQAICTKDPSRNCYKNAAHIGSTGTYAFIAITKQKNGAKNGTTGAQSYPDLITDVLVETKVILSGLLSFPQQRKDTSDVVVISKDNVAYFDVSGQATKDKGSKDLAEGSKDLAKAVMANTHAAAELATTTKSLAETSKDLAEGSKDLAHAVMANTGAAADTVTTTRSLAETSKDLAEGSKDLAHAVMANTGAAADTVTTTRSLAETSKDLAEGSKDLAHAVMANTGAAADTVTTTRSLAETSKDLAEGSKDLAHAVMANTGAAADTVTTTRSLAETSKDLAEGSKDLAHAVMANTGAAADTVTTTRSLAETSKDLAEGSKDLAHAVMANTGAAADTVTTTEGLTQAVETYTGSNETILKDIASALPKDVVRRYVIVRRSGEETIFALAGFKTGRRDLNFDQREWLQDFSKSVQACGGKLPTIRLVGFASAEPNSEDVRRYKHLCVAPPDTPPSDLANCHLANLRLAHVASFWENPAKYTQEQTSNVDEIAAERQPSTVDTMMMALNKSCENRTQYKVQWEGGPSIIAKPWCQIGQMMRERFHVPKRSEPQPDFLNRSVHLRIEDPGSCSNL